MQHKHAKEGDDGRHIPVKPGPPDEEEGREEAVGIEALQAEVEALKAELERSRAEAREYQDKYVRFYAETENFKKRVNRDLIEREKYYNEGIIKEMLPVLDNLERAIGHADETGPEGLVEGVKMVRKQLVDVLAKFGVTQVESVGLPFDPSRQQAIMQVETGEYDEGTVVEEFQKGYFLNDRILRPAMVTVAKRPSES